MGRTRWTMERRCLRWLWILAGSDRALYLPRSGQDERPKLLSSPEDIGVGTVGAFAHGFREMGTGPPKSKFPRQFKQLSEMPLPCAIGRISREETPTLLTIPQIGWPCERTLNDGEFLWIPQHPQQAMAIFHKKSESWVGYSHCLKPCPPMAAMAGISGRNERRDYGVTRRKF